MSKVYIITGSSSGLGRALAEAALAHGDKVVLAVRDPASVDALLRQHADTALAVATDVTRDADRQALAAATLARFGRIDVLVNCAGRGSLGAAEEFSLEQLRGQMELNFFACTELIRAVLPSMRRQGSGHILNVSSIGGRVNIGGFAVYGASKFALEGYSEALRDELAPLGIRVTLIEPGAFRTDFAGSANLRPETSIPAYAPVIEPIRQFLYGNSGKQLGDPRKAAQVMIQVVESAEPPLRLMLGADAYGLWEQKLAAMQAEIAQWRAVGEPTACDDAAFKPIG